MQMTKREIRRSYRSAKNKKLQRHILADLNGCSVEEIDEIISGEQAEKLYNHLDFLDRKIRGLEKEYARTARKIAEL